MKRNQRLRPFEPLIQRSEPDLVSTWVYDTAVKGIGKLADAYTGPVATKTYDRVHTYDSLGRPATNTGATGRSPEPGRLMSMLACLLSPGPLTTQGSVALTEK